MKNLTKWHWLILIALFAIGIWYYSPEHDRSSPPKTAQSELRHSLATETLAPSAKFSAREPLPARPSAEEPLPARPSAEDPLRSVRSPLARRYLRFLLPDSQLDGKSYGISIVNGAFKQAWGVTARLDLSEEQQDQLAEFLLREDWQDWTKMDPEKVREWARKHLSEEQQAALQAYIEESKDGQLALVRMREKAKMKEHGVGSPDEAFAAEMSELKRLNDLLTKDADGLDAKELERKRKELNDLIRERLKGEGNETAESIKEEQSARFYNYLADRIPLTEEQHFALYDALRQRASSPSNPYAYQSKEPERVEIDVRADMEWMKAILTEDQYETYLRHFLAQIEMIRFHNGRS